MLRVDIIENGTDKMLAEMTHPKSQKFNTGHPGWTEQRGDLERGSSLLAPTTTINPHSILGLVTAEGSGD